MYNVNTNREKLLNTLKSTPYNNCKIHSTLIVHVKDVKVCTSDLSSINKCIWWVLEHQYCFSSHLFSILYSFNAIQSLSNDECVTIINTKESVIHWKHLVFLWISVLHRRLCLYIAPSYLNVHVKHACKPNVTDTSKIRHNTRYK